MGLLKHPNKNNRYHNKNLDNPAHINIKNKLSPSDINISHHSQKKAHKTKNSTVNQVTIPINIRVNNHVRNEISALIQLGYAKTHKDLVEKLVQKRVNTLNPEQSKRFNYLKNILEEKDYVNYQFRHHN